MRIISKILIIFVIGLMWINYPQTAHVQALPYCFNSEHDFKTEHMNNQKEIWKDVTRYEGIYQVSNLGRVKSLNRIDSRKHRIFERIMKLYITKFGYYGIKLQINKHKKSIRVHQLVAQEFLGYKIGGLLVVDHKDRNKLNNKLSNLRLITQRENCSYVRENYTSKYVGVCKPSNSKTFSANITINNNPIRLGHFKNEKIASAVYKFALEQYNKGLNIERLYKRKKTSKYIGVSLDKETNKWLTQIRINGMQKKIGRFTSEFDAHIAYQNEIKYINKPE